MFSYTERSDKHRDVTKILNNPVSKWDPVARANFQILHLSKQAIHRAQTADPVPSWENNHHNDIQVVCWKCLHVFWTVASHKAATVKGFCSSARMCLQGGEVEDRNPEWISQLEAGFLEMPCLPPVSSTTSWSDDASSQSLLSSHVIYKKSSLQFVAGQRAWQWGCKALDSAVVVFFFSFYCVMCSSSFISLIWGLQSWEICIWVIWHMSWSLRPKIFKLHARPLPLTGGSFGSCGRVSWPQHEATLSSHWGIFWQSCAFIWHVFCIANFFVVGLFCSSYILHYSNYLHWWEMALLDKIWLCE